MKKFLISLSFTIAAFGAAGLNAAYAQDTDFNRGPLNAVRRSDLICGRGWRFPVLIWGDRPTSACILRTRTRNRFGGDFWF